LAPPGLPESSVAGLLPDAGTDIFHGMAEQEFPGADSLEAGKDIDFLQMEKVFGLVLHRKVTARFAVGRGDEPGELPAHLARKHLRPVHPLHHVLHLRRSDDPTVGRREHLVGKAAYQGAIGLTGPSYRQHHLNQ